MKIIKKLSIGILLLLILGMLASLYDVSGYSQRSSVSWQEKSLPWGQLVTDIGVGHNGHVFTIGTQSSDFRGDLFSWNGNSWRRIQGQLTRISVDDEGDLWGFNKKNEIWKRKNGWYKVRKNGLPKGDLLDIGLARDTMSLKLFVIGPSVGSGKGGHVYQYDISNEIWSQCGERLFTRISVDHSGFPWVMNGYTHKTYQMNGKFATEIFRGYAWYDIGGGNYQPCILGYYRHWRYGASVVKYVDWDHWVYVEPRPWPNFMGTNIDVGYEGTGTWTEAWITNVERKVFSLTA